MAQTDLCPGENQGNTREGDSPLVLPRAKPGQNQCWDSPDFALDLPWLKPGQILSFPQGKIDTFPRANTSWACFGCDHAENTTIRPGNTTGFALVNAVVLPWCTMNCPGKCHGFTLGAVPQGKTMAFTRANDGTPGQNHGTYHGKTMAFTRANPSKNARSSAHTVKIPGQIPG